MIKVFILSGEINCGQRFQSKKGNILFTVDCFPSLGSDTFIEYNLSISFKPFQLCVPNVVIQFNNF